MALTLTYSGNTYDFGLKINSFKPYCIPSYDFNNLVNGKVALKFDLGATADKFMSIIDVTMSFAEFQSFVTWYNLVKGKSLTISTDLDLFFPKVISTSCVITEVKEIGYVGDLVSGYKILELKLYLNENPTYTPISIPSSFAKGIWKNDYKYSDTFNSVQNGINWEYIKLNNDQNNWTVDFDLLTKTEANQIYSWLLGTVRANQISITTNSLNSNSTTSKISNYYIKSFAFDTNKMFYSATLNLVEQANR
jgi:hypothetical protein